MIAAPVLAPRASQPIGRCPEQTRGPRHVHPNLGYYNSIWITGCAPGGTGEVRLVERNNESNVIARATIVVVQYTVPSHILHLRQTNQLDGALRVTWDAPRRTGGSDIVGYAVQHRLDGAAWASESPPVRDTFGPGTSHTVTGLTNGRKYHIRVTPCNRESACLHWSERMGFSHASVSGRPQASPPPPPVNKPGPVQALTLTPGDHKLGVRWQAPQDNGGRDITRYQVQYKLAAVTSWTSNPEVTISDPAVTTVTTTVPILTGDDRRPLTNGAPYHVQVRACNGSSNNDCGDDWKQGLGTPEAPRPRNLDVVPLASHSGSSIDRSAVLTWDEVPGATTYEVEARILGQSAWPKAKCEGDTDTTRGQVSQLQCVIDLEYFTNVGGAIGLQDHKAYAMRVRALSPQTSAFSEPIVIVDTTIVSATGDSSRVDVTWTPVDAIHSELNAGGFYQLRYRKFAGNGHTTVSWNPEAEGFDPTRFRVQLPPGSTSHPILNLQDKGLYAIQLIYDSPIDPAESEDAGPVKVFAARDAYAWPSNSPPVPQSRVGSFPLLTPLINPDYADSNEHTYGYRICEETFPVDPSTVTPANSMITFINHAMEQWEIASRGLVAMTHEVYTFEDAFDESFVGQGKPCANYSTAIAEARVQLQPFLGRPVSEADLRNVTKFVRKMDRWLEIHQADQDLSEIKFVKRGDAVGSAILSQDSSSFVQAGAELANSLGFARCVFDAPGCAPTKWYRKSGEPETVIIQSTDILLWSEIYELHENYFRRQLPRIRT